MTKSNFLILFAERLQIANKNLTIETELKSLEEWDSWNALELMTLVDETFGVTLTAKDLATIETFEDLITKIGIEKFD
ncbi:MAG: acyl carrier protein [Verrucomicrobia bacterium]|nr:acyl carrier protein [Verrucomicrobiota bacterium]